MGDTTRHSLAHAGSLARRLAAPRHVGYACCSASPAAAATWSRYCRPVAPPAAPFACVLEAAMYFGRNLLCLSMSRKGVLSVASDQGVSMAERHIHRADMHTVDAPDIGLAAG